MKIGRLPGTSTVAGAEGLGDGCTYTGKEAGGRIVIGPDGLGDGWAYVGS
jgi:hypothetical protein